MYKERHSHRLSENYSREKLHLGKMFMYNFVFDGDEPVFCSGAQDIGDGSIRVFSRYFAFEKYKTDGTNLLEKNDNFEEDFKFVRDVGVTFQMIFNNIIEKKIKKKWTLKDKEMQYIKRGRYAEFNLLYDRGTKFGLQTGGNVEGILMSLPPIAKWK